MELSYKKRFVSVKKNRDFNFLFRKGTSIVTHGFVCYYRENRHGKNRCGVMTSKKIGNAVKRNRARRIIVNAFRLIEPKLREKTAKHYDFIFVSRGKTPSMKSTQIFELMEKQILSKLK